MHRAITSVVEALKASPLLLVILTLNLSVVAVLVFLLSEIAAASKADRETRNTLLKDCVQRGAKP